METGLLLLVEDNDDDLALVLRTLKKCNFLNEIVVARDGIEALAYLHGDGVPGGQEPIEPTVVLLDLKLPKVDGLEVLERIRADPRTKLQPVVVLTSSDEEIDVVRSYQLGANSYVRKPVDFGEFSKAVTELGLYWMLLNKKCPAGQE